MAHTPDSTDHETLTGHDAHDSHGHGHGGGQSLGFEIIPENSAADGLLKLLACFALAGLFVFASVMIYASMHHEAGEHAAPNHHVDGAESGTAPEDSPSNLSPSGSPENAEHH